ncbi:hypothetical protein ACJRO7_011399 [Eucalyptus globulus]|uniref:Uncharacterized protein n=1 Tax=Eucalyptus globulus TaxID=34317 RepID=A0ABD3LPV5_EUCGL
MGYDHTHHFSTATIVFLISILFVVSSNLDLALAARPLPEEGWSKNISNSRIESLRRGPVPPSSSSSCTNIPGQNRGKCTLSGMNVAGRAFARGPRSTFPAAVMAKI